MKSDPRQVTTTINSERFAEICSKVWEDRSTVLTGRGLLSGEAALVRAVYWRLRKSAPLPANGVENCDWPQTVSAYQLGVRRLLELNGDPNFDCAPILEELIHRYKYESDVPKSNREAKNQRVDPAKALG